MKTVRTSRIVAPCALLAVLVPLSAGAGSGEERIELYLDTAGAGGGLVCLAEATGTVAPPPVKLRGVELLQIDFQGRTRIDALLPGRPRFLDDVPGASRIELPGGGGFLYRHARELASGAKVFGFLRVTPEGLALPVAERPGTGPAGDQDPWLTRVAIDAGGARILAATRHAAGGDVLEIDLVQRTSIDRSPNVPPLNWLEGGLALGDGFAVAISNRGVFRFDLDPGEVVQRVPMGQPAPTWYSGGVVFSPNRQWAITTSGTAEAQAHAWVFSRTSAGRRATETPRHLTGAGFLPDALGGPFMAVADDGATAAWRARMTDPEFPNDPMADTREAFLGRVQPPPGEVPVQVTRDDYFIDTLDEVIILIAVQVGKYIMVVGGRPNDGDPQEIIENAEFYRVSLDANGAAVFENITNTSNDPVQPYSGGTLAPNIIRDVPESGGYLVWDEQSGGTGRLLHVRPDQTGFQTILPDVKELDFVEGIGDELALSVQRRFGSSDPHQVLRMPRDLSTAPVVLDQVQVDVQYLYPVSTADGWLAFLARLDTGTEMVQRIDIHAGGLETFPLGSGSYGDVLGLSPGGALMVSHEAGGVASFHLWPFDGQPPVQLGVPALPGHYVPGQ